MWHHGGCPHWWCHQFSVESTGYMTSSMTPSKSGTEVVNRTSSGHQSNFHSPSQETVEPLKHRSTHGCPRLGLQPRGVLVSRQVEPLELKLAVHDTWGPYQRTELAKSVRWYGRPRQHGGFRAWSFAVFFFMFCSFLLSVFLRLLKQRMWLAIIVTFFEDFLLFVRGRGCKTWEARQVIF